MNESDMSGYIEDLAVERGVAGDSPGYPFSIGVFPDLEKLFFETYWWAFAQPLRDDI